MSWMSFGCVALVFLVVLLLSQIRQAKAAATVAAHNNHQHNHTNGANNNNKTMECSNISSRQTSTPPHSHLLITMGATSPVASSGGASTPGAAAAAPSSSASAATTTASTAVATTTTSSSSSTASVAASSTTQTVPGPSASAATISSSDNSNVINTNNNSSNSVLSGAMPTQSGLQLNTLLPIDFGGCGGGNKTEDANNSSLASAMSEGQRSLSGAPSASSSPILSPPGKIFGRNANGTLIATSRPSNEAEIQLYRVLQRASLLAYYDTLLEMGGDDVQQLYEAGEEEFLEIMALVGMASKPLHVRRLQKALHEWANNPALFQGGPLAAAAAASQGLCDTPTKVPTVATGGSALFGGVAADSTPAALRYKFSPFTPTPLLSTAQATTHSAHLLSQMCSPSLQLAASGLATAPPVASVSSVAPAPQTCQLPSALSGGVGGGGPSGGAAPGAPLVTSIVNTAANLTIPAAHPAAQQHLPPQQQQQPTAQQQQPPSLHSVVGSAAVSSVLGASLSSVTSHQVTSSSPQLTPVLTEMQIARITLGAEKIARHLPQREPRPQTSKKRTTRELEQVMNMSESDPRRMDEIRKYSAIYGRFDCKRRPEKPLTLHEVCVNEAAAQLCRLVPALLTRRDELFPLARQIVKDAGFGHSASIARYGGLLQQMQQTQAASNAAAAVTAAAALSAASLASVNAAGAMQQSVAASLVDCESSDSTTAMPALKRQRLLSMSQDSNSTTTTTTTTTTGTTNPSALGAANAAGQATDISRDPSEDARFNLFAMYQKFAKPPFDIADVSKFSLGRTDFEDNDNDSRLSSFSNSSSPLSLPANGSESERRDHDFCAEHHHVGSSDAQPAVASHQSPPPPSRRDDSVTGVQVISAAGGHIIAVANPALALSPTLHEALNMKREARSPDL